MADHIRYDLLTQKALRGVVRDVLAEAGRKGLAGDHHFLITFDTTAEGVRISERLRAQYPEQMTIVLQHQFWDLTVDERGFEVGLSFGGVPEKLAVPFAAVKGFFDPSVQFGLQFEEISEGEAEPAPATEATAAKPASKKRLPPAAVPAATAPASAPAGTVSTAEAEPSDKPEKPDAPSTGGEVVRLDRFRKK
ncbi:MAG TPA: ClpXP protease specificity-enhancing factor SspB [Pseudolabrys sp.]|nr:ClpXP protease specificity-enhancing factor SspB [Pseudolabrys sp.]